jgi:hypothetical protein
MCEAVPDNDAAVRELSPTVPMSRRFMEVRAEVVRIARELQGATLERVLGLKAEIQALEVLVNEPVTMDPPPSDPSGCAGGAGGPVAGAGIHGGAATAWGYHNLPAPVGPLALFSPVIPDCLCIRPALGTFATFTPSTPVQVCIHIEMGCSIMQALATGVTVP